MILIRYLVENTYYRLQKTMSGISVEFTRAAMRGISGSLGLYIIRNGHIIVISMLKHDGALIQFSQKYHFDLIWRVWETLDVSSILWSPANKLRDFCDFILGVVAYGTMCVRLDVATPSNMQVHLHKDCMYVDCGFEGNISERSQKIVIPS